MRLYASIFFLTLVLSGLAAYSAPITTHQLPAIELSPKEKGEPIFSSVDRTERNWSLRFGYLGGAVSETNLAAQLYYYGLRYDIARETLGAWEIEITTAKDNFLHLVLGKKFYFPLEEVTKPYYRLSVGNMVDSTEGLGSVFNIKKIQAVAAVGLDDLFKMNQRLQGEVAVSYAIIGPQFEMSLGIAF